MNENNLKKLVAQGLSAMQAGSDVAAKATDEINNDARHPALRSALEEGNRTSANGRTASVAPPSRRARPISRTTLCSKRITR